MKKLFTGISLIVISVLSVNGQWYEKKYNVQDINFLTKGQLELASDECKWDLLASAGLAGLGGIIYLIAEYGDMSIDDDSSVFEQLIGERGKRGLGLVGGAAFFAGGTVASIVYIGRKGSINSALRRKDQSLQSLNIAPSVIVNRSSRSLGPGLSFTYKF